MGQPQSRANGRAWGIVRGLSCRGWGRRMRELPYLYIGDQTVLSPTQVRKTAGDQGEVSSVWTVSKFSHKELTPETAKQYCPVSQ